MNSKKTVAVVGASGFVGTQILAKIFEQYKVIALTRTKPKNLPSGVEWRSIDLFSATSTASALVGVDTVIYLVHSMIPSSRLFQGNFYDTDLLLADNFIHGCYQNKIKHIIYLGGLLPTGYISPHLKSRLEVEGVFTSSGIPFTALRAGMIVGNGGSSFELLKNLVNRLPLMVLPKWTQKQTQAIYIDDVIRVIQASIEDKKFKNQVIDLVNSESLTYERLLRDMAKALGKKRIMLPVPIQSTQFSKLWVQFFGDSTYELVSPLIDSLLCDLPNADIPEIIRPYIQYKSFLNMLGDVLQKKSASLAPPSKKSRILHDKSVRSIQRLPSMLEVDSKWIAKKYMEWLPIFFSTLIQVRFLPQGIVHFKLAFLPFPLLILQFVEGSFDNDRIKFHIIGGFLTKTKNTGWLEFRQISNKKYTLTAIHEFVPALPWGIYVCTQAPIHKFVMNRFGSYLEGLKASVSI